MAVPGQEVTVSFFRREELLDARFRMVRNPERRWTFQAAQGKRRLLGRWLGARV
jgi:hypothetical protein